MKPYNALYPLYITLILSWRKFVSSVMLSRYHSGRSEVVGSTREIRAFITWFVNGMIENMNS
jgi:hypothetical protein